MLVVIKKSNELLQNKVRNLLLEYDMLMVIENWWKQLEETRNPNDNPDAQRDTDDCRPFFNSERLLISNTPRPLFLSYTFSFPTHNL